jgi:hypothetical protein
MDWLTSPQKMRLEQVLNRNNEDAPGQKKIES